MDIVTPKDEMPPVLLCSPLVRRQLLFVFLITGAYLLATTGVMQAAELYSDGPLYIAANTSSKVVGEAKSGKVTIVERRGFWAKIKSGALVGWTKLSNLSMKPQMVWLPNIDILKDTGRMYVGKE